jgi:tetratricopeptide (TPR) repeat protein
MALGAICGAMGQRDRATEFFDEALAGFRDIGDRRSEAMLFLERSRALLIAEGGDTRERLGDALSSTDHCLAVFREIGDPFWTTRALHHKSEILTALDRHDEASECSRHAQEIAGTLLYYQGECK